MPDDQPLYYVWNYTGVDRQFFKQHLEDWLPRRLFDAHTHINEPRYRTEEPTEAMRKQYWVNEVNEPIGFDDARRCYETVFPGREVTCLAFGHPSLDYDISAGNDDLIRRCADVGWYSLAVVRPQQSAEELRELLDRPNVLGVKVYYALISHDPQTRDKHLEASIFDFLPEHQLDVLNERHAWVTLHVPRADRLGHRENVREIHRIRKHWPNIVLVIAHFGRCYTLPHAAEALPAFADEPGLYFDNSAVLNPQVHQYALETLGPKRILYGTDNPIFYMRGRRRWEGKRYFNRTSYPFHFNTSDQREPAEVEAHYTLYMYQALRALKAACRELNLTARQIEDILHDNAMGLAQSVLRVKALRT
jgi:uncharacterized protein